MSGRRARPASLYAIVFVIGTLMAGCGTNLSPAASLGSPAASERSSAEASVVSTAEPGQQPPGCLDAELYFEPSRGVLLMANCVDQMDLASVERGWGWDGRSWALVDAQGPDALVVPGIAYDTRRATLIRYGGLPLDSNTCVPETWEWDGVDWARVDATSPPACDHMKLVYDAGMGATLLFGGQDAAGNPSAETWAWDSAAWQRVATAGPPFRAHFEFVNDPVHQRTLLWGGYDGHQVFGDFWSWDGSSWTELTIEGPSARSHASMAFSPDGLLLFGGATTAATYGSLTNETWYLTNGRWSLLEGPAPSPRGMAAIGYDSERGVMVLFGGFDAAGAALADTWEWDSGWRCLDGC